MHTPHEAGHVDRIKALFSSHSAPSCSCDHCGHSGRWSLHTGVHSPQLAAQCLTTQILVPAVREKTFALLVSKLAASLADSGSTELRAR
mgnify:CR=1 FL=1